MGLQRASSPRHQDLSDALTKHYNENVQKLKVSDLSVTQKRVGPMKKAHLKAWKFAWQTKKNKATSGIAPLKDDRAHITRFLVVILSRPDLHMEDTISTFKITAFPRTLLI